MGYKGLFFLFLGSLIVTSTGTASECSECVQRKQNLCAKECELVKPEVSIKCQVDCLKDYCKHKCPGDAPEFGKFLDTGCQECLEQQYNLCEPKCITGTDRTRALCRLNCSEDRCVDKCKEILNSNPGENSTTQ